jgi:hypothetical protein
MGGEHIRAVAYWTDGLWIVQALEYDIRARAYERDEAPRALIKAFKERRALNKHLGRKGLEGIRPAPPEYEAMFNRVAARERRVEKADGEVEVAFA